MAVPLTPRAHARPDYLDRLLHQLTTSQGDEESRDMILGWFSLHTLESVAGPAVVAELRTCGHVMDNHELHGHATHLRQLADRLAAVVAPTRTEGR